MPQQEYQLTETQPGVYSRAAPALVMVGHWALAFQITPKAGDAVHRADRRPGRRMTAGPSFRLFASLIGFAAGALAAVIAIQLLASAL